MEDLQKKAQDAILHGSARSDRKVRAYDDAAIASYETAKEDRSRA